MRFCKGLRSNGSACMAEVVQILLGSIAVEEGSVWNALSLTSSDAHFVTSFEVTKDASVGISICRPADGVGRTILAWILAVEV